MREASPVSVCISLPSVGFLGTVMRKCVCSQQKSRWLAIQVGGDEVWRGKVYWLQKSVWKSFLILSHGTRAHGYLCRIFPSWEIISFHLEFSFMVQGQRFYGAVDYFYLWNIKWKCVVFLFSSTVSFSISVLLMQRVAAPGEQQIYRSIALL